MKPFSQASENNKSHILDKLMHCFADRCHVLEIGSGTGQHAVYFSANLPHLIWQTSDRVENHEGIHLWCNESDGDNLRLPIALDVSQPEWPSDFDGVYSSNTAHIMPWELTKRMLTEVATGLPSGGIFALYGPFKYNGEFTSESNASFDAFLKASNPSQGIRDFEKVNDVAKLAGLTLLNDYDLPANNRLLVWRKRD